MSVRTTAIDQAAKRPKRRGRGGKVQSVVPVHPETPDRDEVEAAHRPLCDGIDSVNPLSALHEGATAKGG